VATISRRTTKASAELSAAVVRSLKDLVNRYRAEWRDSRKLSASDSAKASSPTSTVEHPSHDNAGKIEVIDFIEDQRLGFHLGNVVKYIARSAHKGHEAEDLKKARWYLDRYLSTLDDRCK